MKKNEKFDKVEQCFNNLFTKIARKSGDYLDTLVLMSLYLVTEDDNYDDILKEVGGVNKQLIVQMIFSKFFEMNHYREKVGIKLDDYRKNILNLIDNLEPNSLVNILCCEVPSFTFMINDVLLYLWHPSDIFSYNAVKLANEDGLAEILHEIYPIAKLDHELTLENSYTDKEYLLYTLIETMINCTEKLVFSNGKYIITSGYIDEVVSVLKEHNGTNPALPNLHKEILEEFNSRIGITKEANFNKLLILEVFFSTLKTKYRLLNPQNTSDSLLNSTLFANAMRNNDMSIYLRLQDSYDAAEEKESSALIELILNELNKKNASIESLSKIYDDNEQKIISLLINNWCILPEDVILSDVKEFEKIKKDNTKSKKRKPE